ncbi:hypothetical protein BDN71DRAFT_517818 [Pleurotus eryngii]|uniref:Uncharacterized protein n=1 Tax=Pleurotus eryngii TaxID=5323 RepID=A0A9P6A1T4_PLEER|nr:hypothetical protein BDN71DRAFT_517818 [Pleurotus eryngii]
MTSQSEESNGGALVFHRRPTLSDSRWPRRHRPLSMPWYVASSSTSSAFIWSTSTAIAVSRAVVVVWKEGGALACWWRSCPWVIQGAFSFRFVSFPSSFASSLSLSYLGRACFRVVLGSSSCRRWERSRQGRRSVSRRRLESCRIAISYSRRRTKSSTATSSTIRVCRRMSSTASCCWLIGTVCSPPSRCCCAHSSLCVRFVPPPSPRRCSFVY